MEVSKSLIALASLAVIGAVVAPALAGTKVQENIVPSSATSPPGNPTLSTAGKFQMDDKGKVQVTLKGVTDGAGAPVTSSGSYASKTMPVLDGTQYVAVFRATFTALGLGIEGAVPVELKKGNGTGKFSQAALFSLIPAGLGRSVELNGVEIWGPLGAGNVAACTAVVTAGYSVVANDPSCRGGTKIGVAGISIP